MIITDAQSLTTNGDESSEKVGNLFIERLKWLAKHVGGQAEFARRLNTTPQYVQKRVGKEPSVPGGVWLERIARATGCSPAWLLTGEGQPFPPQRPESAEGQAALAAIAGRAVSMAVDGMRQLQAALPLLDAMPDLAAFDQAREDLDAALRDRTDKTRKVEVSEPPDMTTRKNSGQRKGPPAGDAAPEKGT